jgi:hypothetical protein
MPVHPPLTCPSARLPLAALPQCFIFFGTSFLLARQALCVAGSLTTNELIMWHKYDYLQDQQRSLRNPFDDGPVGNCIQVRHKVHLRAQAQQSSRSNAAVCQLSWLRGALLRLLRMSTSWVACFQMAVPCPPSCLLQFWSEARPDWYALYVQRRQGGQPDAGQGEGQAGSSAASSPWRPPFLSVATLLRKWEQARSALHASRRAKQQRREQWMLQQYGGVTAAVAEQQGLIADGHAGCRSCEGHHHT